MFKPNDFKCPICKEIRERGVLVMLGKKAGHDYGVIVKVCKKGKCKVLAEEGIRLFSESILSLVKKS